MKSYEEKYIDLVRNVLRKGFKLEDSTVSLHSTVRLSLQDYIPLLHSSYVNPTRVNEDMNVILESIPESLMIGLGSSYFKPVRLLVTTAIPDISCVVDENGVFSISATCYEANLLGDVPYFTATIWALGNYLCNVHGFKPGSLSVTFNFVSLGISEESKVKSLLKNYSKISSLDHPFKRYALLTEWNDVLFKVPNYKVNKTCFPGV